MEVDRISKIGSVGPQATPSWPTRQVRRRRFVEEFDSPSPESQAEEEAEPQGTADDGDAKPAPPEPIEREDECGTVLDILA